MRMLAILWAVLPAWSVCTVTPTSVTLDDTRQHGPASYGQPLTVSADCGSWTATNPAFPNNYWVFHATSGTAPSTIYVYPNAGVINTKAVGSYASASTIAGISVTVTVNVKQRDPHPLHTNYKGAADTSFGCGTSDSDPMWMYEDNCTVYQQRPGGTWNMPTGATPVTDNLLGTPYWKVSNGFHAYSSISPVDLDDRYVVVEDSDTGTAGFQRAIYNLDGSGLCVNVSDSGFSGGAATWGQTEATKNNLYSLIPGQTVIRKFTLTPCTSIVNDGVIWTHPTAKTLDTGGGADMNTDNYLGFYSLDFTQVWAVKVTDTSKAYSYTTSDAGYTLTDIAGGVYVGNKTKEGWYYVWVQGSPSGFILRFREDQAGTEMELVSDCHPNPSPGAGTRHNKYCDSVDINDTQAVITSGHSDAVTLSDGLPYQFYAGSVASPFVSIAIGFGMTQGKDGALPYEVGGGMRLGSNRQGHIGCARQAPICVGSNVTTTSVTSYTITAVNSTAGNNYDFTLSAAHGWSVGQAIQISNVFGLTGANGTFTVDTVPTTTRITIAVSHSGTWTSNTGVVTANASPGRIHDNELHVWREGEVRRVAAHRSVKFSASRIDQDYWYQPHAAISPKGTYVIWSSNNGQPDALGVYAARTGMSAVKPNQFTKDHEVHVTPAATKVIFRLCNPSSQTVTFEVDNDRDLSSVTASGTTGVGCGDVILTGLTASTRYFWQARSNAHTAMGEFLTTATPSGTRSTRFEAQAPTGATEVYLDYGTTASLGSTTSGTPVSCTAGQLCGVAVDATRGDTLYGRLVFDAGPGQPLQSLMVQ